MADYALPALSDDEPCGPDLDFAGDGEFLNYLSAVEGQLPTAFFSFDRKTLDFPPLMEGGDKLLHRSQDLRVLLALAKLAILNRDFAAFSTRVCQIGWLLENRWDAVHPRAEDGDYASRIAQLSTLDDNPVVILPLQYATLLETRRDGPLMYRAQMIALGDAKLRDGEQLPSAGTIDRMLSTIDMGELSAAIERVEDVKRALEAIYRVTIEHVGFEQAVSSKALRPLVDKIVEFLKAAQAKRDPSLSEADSNPQPNAGSAAADADRPAAPPAALSSLADIDQALGAALGYFQRNEPSSPALLLIGQARETLGKDLYAVMRLLAPNHADAARLFVGPEGAFSVQVSALANASLPDMDRGEPEPADSRAAALALIDAVAAHMRKAEPSSPAPFLLERARSLASRDFLSLLHELMPEDDLDSMKRGR